MTDEPLTKLATQGILGLFCTLFLIALVYCMRELQALHAKRFTDVQALADKAEQKEEQRRASIDANTQAMRDLSASVRTLGEQNVLFRDAINASTNTTGSLRDAILKGRSSDRIQAVRGKEG